MNFPTSRISTDLDAHDGEDVEGRVVTSERRCPIRAAERRGRGRIDYRTREADGGGGREEGEALSQRTSSLHH